MTDKVDQWIWFKNKNGRTCKIKLKTLLTRVSNSKIKAKAFEEQKEMRKECADFIKDCSTFHLQEIHSEIRRLKNYRKDRF